MPDLFSPYELKSVRLKNRIVMSPMCQYSAIDGVPTEWHHVHLGSHAIGGSGLIIAEATAVSPAGRISPGDTGLWNDAQRDAFAPIVRFIESQGALPGIQLAHAGRKASAQRPWEGDAHLPPEHPEAWQPVAPSALAFGANLPRVPHELTVLEIMRIRDDFVAATKRAVQAGFKWLVLHFAHGYLGQSFFSPLANKRTDAYGGRFANRARFLLETLEAVREVWPREFPLTARLGVIDYIEGEQPLTESIELVRQMKAGGLDLVDVSMGFNTPDVSKVPWGEHAFLAPLAARIRKEVGIPVTSSWNFSDAVKINELIQNGSIDVVNLGKTLLSDPNWPYHAAQTLGKDRPQDVLAIQYGHWLKQRGEKKTGRHD